MVSIEVSIAGGIVGIVNGVIRFGIKGAFIVVESTIRYYVISRHNSLTSQNSFTIF